jgi:hypothetical protein
VDPFDAFSLAGDGYRLVDRFLGVRSSMQPHHAIGIGIDVDIPGRLLSYCPRTAPCQVAGKLTELMNLL